MTQFTFQPRVGDSDKISAALGVSNAAKFSDSDVNKLVKLAGADNYVPVAAGDDIEGCVIAIAPHTVNDGFSFGTVQTGGRMVAKVVAAGTTVAVRDAVVAAAQAALGTAQDNPIIKKVAAETPTIKWRVISLLGGGGTAGELVLIERVN
jgi:hypothetical protein